MSMLLLISLLVVAVVMVARHRHHTGVAGQKLLTNRPPLSSPNVTPELSLGALEVVENLLRHHRKIEAIKIYRAETRVGLKEAKDAIEALDRDLQGRFPRAVALTGEETSQPELPLSALAEVEILLSQGQKIEAVKLYREHTGVSLKDAKDAVELLERGEVSLPQMMSSRTSPRFLPLDEIHTLLRSGQKIGAIKLYREQTRVGLKEAKDAVEAIERAAS